MECVLSGVNIYHTALPGILMSTDGDNQHSGAQRREGWKEGRGDDVK